MLNGLVKSSSIRNRFAMEIPNPELQLANDFVQHTNCNIFLTGKAGTGKTTFLHHLKAATPKRMIVTAPTGVAAINAGGVTLHSFFQMPFGPFVPGSEAHECGNQRKFSKEKRNLIKCLDLLVIDEISMVRADLLDGVDAVLRRYRRSELPFGGVQLLMIGDLHQLPPVVKDEEWSILRQHYDSVYFFASHALGRTELMPIELKHNYRQSDNHFIELLNRVRDNQLDPATLQKLNGRCLRNFSPGDHEGYITLCTHNHKSETINQLKLGTLPKKAHRFKAEIEGDFPEYTYPTAARLELKVDAQVMFVRNDASPEKRYFNGKIGKLTRILSSRIYVKCAGDDQEIPVEPATWENIKYSLDPQTREITESKIGKFVQYPLKLAWAITIHKSQGLTFERAIIDAADAFAHGQVYVALSRCKTLEGLMLSSPIASHAVKTDATVLAFDGGAKHNPPSAEKLEAAKIDYQQRLLMECFDFKRFRGRLHHFVRVLLENARLLRILGVDDIQAMERQATEEVCVVSENFQLQLKRLLANRSLPESDAAILERTAKASGYFEEKLAMLSGTVLQKLRIETDNKEIRRKVKEAGDQLREETAVKLTAVKSCRTGFSPAAYLDAVSAAEIEQPVKEEKVRAVEYTASEVSHPDLFQALKEWRAAKAAAEEVDHYRVLHQRLLIQIAVTLPDNLPALRKIKGIGKRTAEKYGEELVALVTAYRRKNRIEAVALPESNPPPDHPEPQGKKGSGSDTRQLSFEMFQAGLTIAGIAENRGLTRSTIEGHLAFYIEAGRLEIDRLLSPRRKKTIEQKLTEMEQLPLGEIKRALGDEYSYGEIKFVQACRKHLAENKPGPSTKGSEDWSTPAENESQDEHNEENKKENLGY